MLISGSRYDSMIPPLPNTARARSNGMTMWSYLPEPLQKEVLEETNLMFPDTKRRLAAAHKELVDLVAGASVRYYFMPMFMYWRCKLTHAH